MDTDYAVIGGGVVGLSVTHGLLAAGRRVTVLDEGDRALRASRGNFGLVWVQGKGLDEPRYARWTQASAARWAGLAERLAGTTGIDVSLQQQGGLDLHLEADELAARVAAYERLHQALAGDYPFDVLTGDQVRQIEPAAGPEVVGAILHHQDGHVNPLRLLRALAQDVRQAGAQVLTGCAVERIEPPRHAGGPFRVFRRGNTAPTEAARVVLAAGLGAARLGPTLGLRALVRPQRGQILVTEKMGPLLRRPGSLVRQVDEGGVQIGDSKDEVGFDDRDSLDTLAMIARRAVRLFPALSQARLVRSWAALRVMSPDGLPVYQASRRCPGAFLVTCHSGITLAAAHAQLLPAWLEGRDDAPDLACFSENRFPDKLRVTEDAA